MIFDSHAHYDDEAFDEDRERVLDEVAKSGIGYVMNAGCNIESSKASVELANRYRFIYAAVGVHPEDANEFNEDTTGILKSLCKNKKVSAIGEIGLDYYYKDIERDTQRKVFEEQIKLALELNLPVIVHDRDAHADTFEIISKYMHHGLRGVLHCYSGSTQMAEAYIKHGFYLGFNGVITFKNAKKSIEVLKSIPADKILIETDCPYLAPVPKRGERNDSRNLYYVIQKACQVLNIERDYFIKQTCENAKNLFNIAD